MTTPQTKAERSPYGLTKLQDVDGLVIHSSEPRMQRAFHSFVRLELGMNNPVLVGIPTGVQSLVSPLSLKLAHQLTAGIRELVNETQTRRVVFIISDGDLDGVSGWKSLIRIPFGRDVKTHAMGLAKSLLSKSLGLEVEGYLAKVKGEEVAFFRVDQA